MHIKIGIFHAKEAGLLQNWKYILRQPFSRNSSFLLFVPAGVKIKRNRPGKQKALELLYKWIFRKEIGHERKEGFCDCFG